MYEKQGYGNNGPEEHFADEPIFVHRFFVLTAGRFCPHLCGHEHSESPIGFNCLPLSRSPRPKPKQSEYTVEKRADSNGTMLLCLSKALTLASSLRLFLNEIRI